MNRAEYNNTVRDLLGVDLRPGDDFPQDDSGYGFDNIADVLSLSPALMEKYMTSAERVARTAVFGPPPMAPTLIRLRSDGRRNGEARTLPVGYDLTGLSLPNAFHAVHRIPVEGEYMIRVFLGGLRPANSEPITVALWVDDEQVADRAFDVQSSATFADDRQDFGGQTTEIRVRLPAGDHRIAVAIPRLYEGLPPRFNGPAPSKRPDKPREFTPRPGATPDQIAAARKRFDDATAELEKIPLNARAGQRGRDRRALRAHQRTIARERAIDLHVRAPGRRPYRGVHDARGRRSGAARVPPARRARLRSTSTPRSLVGRRRTKDRSTKDSSSASRRCSCRRTSCSASSVRRRRGRPASGEPVTQHQLASRLSYFLWASMPDEELRRAADTGTLRDPRVLSAQVRRMLRDPKAQALAEQFGGQWLQFRALESTTRNRERFPDFEDYLRLSMRRETELFVAHIVREDRSILDFLDARYSFMNERLARHYGIAGVSGPEFRRVDLAGTPRGGVLTHASVLTVSSYATRTSPVLRGKWILDNLLNAPPPEPPADVPNLDETTIGTAASMREQLQAHRKNPTCASCHRRMDPLGFGLENFDAVGAWRTTDGKFPIDASGKLPDGSEFTGPGRASRRLAQPARGLRRGPDVEIIDLRARARPGALR